MKKSFIFLIIILIIAAFLRFWKLSENPEGFHADEAAFGYNAYSLLQTGRDEYGKFLPLILKSFGDEKGALYAYFTVPFVKLFGLNEWSVRAPTALSGTAIVLIVFLLTHLLTQSRPLSLFSAFLLAVSPVSIVLSRVQSDPLVSVLFTLISIYLIIRWIKEKKYTLIIFGSFSCLLALFTYQTPRIFFLLFIPLLFLWFYKEMNRLQKMILLFIFAGISLFVFYIVISSGSRFGQVSMFGRADVVLILEENIREDGISNIPVTITRIFHNKIGEHIRYFAGNYAKYLSFDFLFWEAKEPLRERIPGMGIMYLVELPFLLYGMFVILQKKIRWGMFLFSWLVLGILTFAFAVDETPNIHRFYIVLYPLLVFVALGIQNSIANVYAITKKPYGIFMISILYGVNIIYFFHQLFIHQPANKPYYRDYAYKELIQKLQQYESQYTTIIFTKANSSPYIHYLFHTRYDPARYQLLGSPRDLDNVRFEKFLFAPEDCPSTSSKYDELKMNNGKKTLFINRGGCINSANVFDTVFWKNKMEAFQLVEYSQ